MYDGGLFPPPPPPWPSSPCSSSWKSVWVDFLPCTFKLKTTHFKRRYQRRRRRPLHGEARTAWRSRLVVTSAASSSSNSHHCTASSGGKATTAGQWGTAAAAAGRDPASCSSRAAMVADDMLLLLMVVLVEQLGMRWRGKGRRRGLLLMVVMVVGPLQVAREGEGSEKDGVGGF
jgi:hypothetical protein